MKIVKINLLGDYSEALKEAVRVLREGGTVVYPTDTIYGIGCNATDFKAVETIYRIKDRPESKPLSVIARNMAWIRELAFVPPKLEPILEQLWPGAITIILPKKPIIPSIVTAGGDTVGLRIPDYELTDKLMAKFGYPIISTSANMAGMGDEQAGNIAHVIENFKPRMWQPDLVLDAGNLPLSSASTIIDFSTVKPKIIRIGAVKPRQLETILKLET